MQIHTQNYNYYEIQGKCQVRERGERAVERESVASLLSMAAKAFNTFATKPNAKRQKARGGERGREEGVEVEEGNVEAGRATVLVPARVQASPRHLLALPRAAFSL